MWFAGKKWADFLQRSRWITLLLLSVELAVVQSTDFYRTSDRVCKWIEESFSKFLIRNLILKWDWDIGTGQEQATLHEVHSQRDRSGLKNEQHCSQYWILWIGISSGHEWKYALCFEVARTPEIGLQELENTESAINFENGSRSANGSTDHLRLLQPAHLHLSFVAKRDPYFQLILVCKRLCLVTFSKSKAQRPKDASGLKSICNDLPWGLDGLLVDGTVSQPSQSFWTQVTGCQKNSVVWVCLETRGHFWNP